MTTTLTQALTTDLARTTRTLERCRAANLDVAIRTQIASRIERLTRALEYLRGR